MNEIDQRIILNVVKERGVKGIKPYKKHYLGEEGYCIQILGKSYLNQHEAYWMVDAMSKPVKDEQK